ncbi:alpha/beta fold hydrolase [Nocardia jinanensis]|uniref:Hydrolase n=1 Tax=Nocardia jinanensis TaxID=382504 RepID=A0A917VXS4_9NOCA|nr:alpha/beta hydrolase [Nocardia jinanensis]GGL31500.1 hydrolase [Nocardia jinanensis]
MNSVELAVTVAGSGPGLVLLHGWPHTRRVWERVIAALARDHRVIAPDLRGLGDSARPATGYDAATLAGDIAGLLDGFDLPDASVMALDASVPAAFLFAMRHPERVRRLVLMESLLTPLPGAEEFLAAGPPWWFGFHAVPGLAEKVLVGHEAAYIGWFLEAGTTGPDRIPADLRAAFVRAYTGAAALRGGFSYYRAMPENARLIAAATAASRLRVPTLALGAGSVGSALHRQLSTVADDLIGRVIPDCGHIIPLDRPEALLAEVVPFLR